MRETSSVYIRFLYGLISPKHEQSQLLSAQAEVNGKSLVCLHCFRYVNHALCIGPLGVCTRGLQQTQDDSTISLTGLTSMTSSTDS